MPGSTSIRPRPMRSPSIRDISEIRSYDCVGGRRHSPSARSGNVSVLTVVQLTRSDEPRKRIRLLSCAITFPKRPTNGSAIHVKRSGYWPTSLRVSATKRTTSSSRPAPWPGASIVWPTNWTSPCTRVSGRRRVNKLGNLRRAHHFAVRVNSGKSNLNVDSLR